MTSLVTLLADPDLALCQPTVLLLLRTSSILLYSVPAVMVFLLTAILSLYVTIKVRKVFISLHHYCSLLLQAFRRNSVTPLNVFTVQGECGSSTATRNNSRRSSKTPHLANSDARFAVKFSLARTERNTESGLSRR